MDPATFLQFLSNLSSEEREQFMGQDQGDDVEEEVQSLSTQQGMIQRFQTMRARFVRPEGIFGGQVFGENWTARGFSIDDTKPRSDSRSLGELKPMIGIELELGKTHRGRYLCGWVAIDDAFFGIASSSLLVEDVTGFLVEIAAYGLVDTERPPHERQRVVASRFPKGQPIVVIEPYYKMRLDGSAGIRVDEAEEIVQWRDVPTDLMSWKELGNDFFSVLSTRNKGLGALACYQRALEAAGDEIHTTAVLLNNMATCRFKMGDLDTSIQLAGAAAHLDPAYLKAWFRLVSALVKAEKRALAACVADHALKLLPDSLAQELQFLKTIRQETPGKIENSCFRSYAEWCVGLPAPELALVDDDLRGEEKTADEWRQEGSAFFVQGNFEAAQESYRKGLAALWSCCCNVSVVLNNIAAVYLMLPRDSAASVSLGNGVPSIEAALLNCTVSGIIDPLNHKAWLRRARCLQSVGFGQERCVKDLKDICTSIVMKAVTSTVSIERVKEFKSEMDVDIMQRLQKCAVPKAVHDSPATSTREQREQHNERSSSVAGDSSTEEKPSFSEDGDIDHQISQMEGFVNRMRMAHAVLISQSNPRPEHLPREILMFQTNPPPEVHTEFPRLRGWPEGINAKLAKKVLYHAYLKASMNPWIGALAMRDGIFFDHVTPEDMVKRWHGTAGIQLIATRGIEQCGSIVDGRELIENYVPTYTTRTRSSFSNKVSRADVYYFNSTHVAIGFKDFSNLLSAALCKNSAVDAPLRFVGFEMSEFAVSKCMVVAKMLGSSSVSISSVMEVWLSSTWSETTLRDFRGSVDAVLESLRGRDENPKVVQYLRHWASTDPVSAEKARSNFFSNMVRKGKLFFLSPYSFSRQIDRLDLMQYMLSGEIRATSNVLDAVGEKQTARASDAGSVRGTTSKSQKKRKKKAKKKQAAKRTAAPPSSPTLVGSLTMSSVPPGSPPLEAGIAFNTVDFMDLVEDFTERGQCPLSIVDLFMIHIMKGLRRLRDLILSHKLTIEVNYGVVKAVKGETVNDSENRELLERIANLRPQSISWSNVLDDFLPEDFHDLARRCSTYGNCVHYGYSMNWPTQVLGASIMDYDPQKAKSLIDSVLNAALGFPNESVEWPLPSLVEMFKMFNLDKLLFLPYREHPLNSTGYVLANLFDDEWIDHFMEKGTMTNQVQRRLGAQCTPYNCGLQKGGMGFVPANPLDHSSLTLHMCWCYDPHVRLVQKELGVAVEAEMLARLMACFRG